MSKNFELMQRAGKAWEVPPVIPPEKPVISINTGKKLNVRLRHNGRLDIDQLAREESLRLVQRVFLLQAQTPSRMVVFAGIDHRNGCSRICAQVVEVLESNGPGSVCLVEANFRSPSLSRIFGTTNHHGLTDSLVGEGPIRSFAKPLRSNKLWFLSSGSLAADSHALLNSSRLQDRFEELRNEFDYVVVDAPPLTHYSDAIALGKAADGFVLVLEANSTRREAALKIKEILRANQIHVLGAVLNKRTFPLPDVLYRNL
jgi:capsular exopolysaccharide synthesis family protein